MIAGQKTVNLAKKLSIKTGYKKGIISRYIYGKKIAADKYNDLKIAHAKIVADEVVENAMIDYDVVDKMVLDLRGNVASFLSVCGVRYARYKAAINKDSRMCIIVRVKTLWYLYNFLKSGVKGSENENIDFQGHIKIVSTYNKQNSKQLLEQIEIDNQKNKEQ